MAKQDKMRNMADKSPKAKMGKKYSGKISTYDDASGVSKERKAKMTDSQKFKFLKGK